VLIRCRLSEKWFAKGRENDLTRKGDLVLPSPFSWLNRNHDFEKLGPLLVPKEHQNKENAFRVSFYGPDAPNVKTSDLPRAKLFQPGK